MGLSGDGTATMHTIPIVSLIGVPMSLIKCLSFFLTYVGSQLYLGQKGVIRSPLIFEEGLCSLKTKALEETYRPL